MSVPVSERNVAGNDFLYIPMMIQVSAAQRRPLEGLNQELYPEGACILIENQALTSGRDFPESRLL